MSDKTALVIDDSKSARYAMRKFLESFGYRVDAVENAHEAYAFLKQQQPGVIFLDHVMPDVDGIDVLRAVKQDQRTASIPVVLCSSDESEIFVARARAQGAAAVLPKPPDPAYIGSLLKRLSLPARTEPKRAAVTGAVPRLQRHAPARTAAGGAPATMPMPVADPPPSVVSQPMMELAQRLDVLSDRIVALEQKIERRLDEPALDRLAGGTAERLTMELAGRLDTQIAGLRRDLEASLHAHSLRLQQLADTVRKAVREESRKVATDAVTARLASLLEQFRIALGSQPEKSD